MPELPVPPDSRVQAFDPVVKEQMAEVSKPQSTCAVRAANTEALTYGAKDRNDPG